MFYYLFGSIFSLNSVSNIKSAYKWPLLKLIVVGFSNFVVKEVFCVKMPLKALITTYFRTLTVFIKYGRSKEVFEFY